MGIFDSIGNLFSGGGKYKNPANSAMPYLNQIPGQTQPYQQPWFDAGKAAIPGLTDQYNQAITNPGGKVNDIGQSYKESPGFKFALQQALNSINQKNAAGGMAGSPQNNQYDMELATNLANQDYNTWLDKALGIYGTGLSGQQHVSDEGQKSGQSMADMIAQMLAQQGNLAYTGQQNENQNNANKSSNMWNNIGKVAGAASAFIPFF
jgi:hypothetical protein